MVPVRVRNDDVGDLFRFDTGRRHGVSGLRKSHYLPLIDELLSMEA